MPAGQDFAARRDLCAWRPTYLAHILHRIACGVRLAAKVLSGRNELPQKDIHDDEPHQQFEREPSPPPHQNTQIKKNRATCETRREEAKQLPP